jgi:threonine/homoserine/homoserine lactone efflux protein
MSPGPSLAVIMQSSMNYGRTVGWVCAWLHALGVGCWALLTIFGIATFLVSHPELKRIIEVVGATYLFFLAWQILRTKNSTPINREDGYGQENRISPAAASFVIAFVNPKLFLFFLALFSQFVSDGQDLIDKLSMAFVAMLVDGIWYSVVATVVTHHSIKDFLERHINRINMGLAVIFIFIAAKVIVFP